MYLWYELMLKYWVYSQKQVDKGNNLCSCAKSFVRQKKTSHSKPHNFLLCRNFFNQDQKTNSQNNSYQCSDPKDVPIVVHTQDWLKGMWPPSSPDYKSLDYFMWSEFEREVNKQPFYLDCMGWIKIKNHLTLLSL